MRPTWGKNIVRMTYVNCFWQGPRLDDLQQISLLSMLRQNYKVRLFCYDPIVNVPAGIELSDAREIMPDHELRIHRGTGSPALGTNKFRYLVMKMGLGVWLDTDVLLIKPLPQDDGYIFGWQDEDLICGAVLCLPQNSSVIDELCDFVAQDYPIPPFFDETTRSALEQKSKSGHPVSAEDMPWGVHGPNALTYFIRKNGLLDLARPREVFYPVHYSEAHVLLSSKDEVKSSMTPRTVAVHLWNLALHQLREKNPNGQLILEKDSFLEKFAREQLDYRFSDSVVRSA